MEQDKLCILYEDNHLIAVNKSTSDLVQGDKTGDVSLDKKLKVFLKEKYNKPGNVFVGVIHRLDRPVSGVVVFAKTSKGLSRMNKLFQLKEMRKVYWAIVQNKPPKTSERIVHHLVRNEKKNKSFAYSEPRKNSKEAALTYKLLASSDRYHLVEVELHTGRHHQIRCQLAAIGCPIKGDLKYGFARSNPDGGISLHAHELSFVHPVKKDPVLITAPLPKSRLWEYFSQHMQKST